MACQGYATYQSGDSKECPDDSFPQAYEATKEGDNQDSYVQPVHFNSLDWRLYREDFGAVTILSVLPLASCSTAVRVAFSLPVVGDGVPEPYHALSLLKASRFSLLPILLLFTAWARNCMLAS